MLNCLLLHGMLKALLNLSPARRVPGDPNFRVPVAGTFCRDRESQDVLGLTQECVVKRQLYKRHHYLSTGRRFRPSLPAFAAGRSCPESRI